MVDFADLIDQIGSLNNTIQESFSVLKDFLLDLQLGVLNLTFIVLFIMFIVLVLLVFSSPAFLYDLYNKQKGALERLFKNDKIPKNWIGKS